MTPILSTSATPHRPRGDVASVYWLGTMALVLLIGGCHAETKTPDVETDGSSPESGSFPEARFFCDLPGSVQSTVGGSRVVPGAPSSPDVAFMKLPVGFCAHHFANVGNTRQLRFAPSGDLFVASPTRHTTGGGPEGKAAIVVLPDDNHDGIADTPRIYASNLPSTQGLLFANGYLYYQDDTRILRTLYRSGERVMASAPEVAAEIPFVASQRHWPKVLDQADDGTIYVTNGDDETLLCKDEMPFRGGVLELKDGTVTPVARGFRNPIALRCLRGKGQCFAVELSRDYSGPRGGREKIVPVRRGDDWGFPCCATKDIPFNLPGDVPDANCAGATPEDVAFLIGDTPFGIDFEPGKWKAPYTGNAFVPLHGSVEGWNGARLVTIEVDPSSGLLKSASDVDGSNSGAMVDFATGWDDGRFLHGRPASVAFAADGRLFLGNDSNGDIIWIAPLDLERTPRR